MKRKLKNEKYKYGNYDRYYSERNTSQWNDSRLALLSRDYFEGKDVLDIGSNDGTLSILLAINYNPKHILGVEIDHKLVNRAVESLVYIEKCKIQLQTEKERIDILEELEDFPKSFHMYMKFPSYIESLKEVISMKPALSCLSERFPSNISFLNGNYIESHIDNEYDTVLCLSTVKWIHLNWGDEGVRILFRKIYRSLRQNGLFIFEPQPWKSYKKSRTRTSEIFDNYHSIEFKPNEFYDYLISMGFSLLKTISPTSQRDNFKRDILVFTKNK